MKPTSTNLARAASSSPLPSWALETRRDLPAVRPEASAGNVVLEVVRLRVSECRAE